jgi:hypothetical protein
MFSSTRMHREGSAARATRRAGGRTIAAALLATFALAALAAPPALAKHPNATGLRIAAGVGSLTPSWGVSTTTSLAGFRLRWRPVSGAKRRWTRPLELGAAVRSFQISPLSFEPYEVRVRALYGRAKKNGSVKRARPRLGGQVTGLATPLSSGETEPPPKEEPPKEEPPVEEEATAPGCNLYASASGRDSNPGTPAAPMRTVPALLAKLTAGQTGCLASGTYSGFGTYAGESHGRQGAPVTITSTNPNAPATIAGRVTTFPGADWLTFSHLTLTDSEVKFPSVSIGSAHTSWLFDDVSAPHTICFEPVEAGPYGPGEDTLIEHDRVHNCGQPFTCNVDSPPCNEPPNDGYFIHGVYDLGINTTIRNSYFYASSSEGILLRGGGGAVVEHNVVDENGSGVIFGDLAPKNDTFAWNIVTNSSGVCGRCLEYYGIWTFGELGPGNVARDNDVFGNVSGNFGPMGKVKVEDNIEVDPQYVNAAKHDYTLQLDSPALGYGPE